MQPNAPLTGAVTVHPNSDHQILKTPQYSAAHQNHIAFRRQRMLAARDIRAMRNPRFDDMTFDEWWNKNELADNSYVKPRTNKGDTEINMGITRDKDNTLLALAMKYEYEPTAQVFDDKDDMMYELAEEAEDLVRKSMHIEMFTEEKFKHIARGMITFGTQLVEEVHLEQWKMEKELKGVVGSSAATWSDKLTKVFDGCVAKAWDLRKCYPGDINKFSMNGPEGQPYFFTAEYLSYDETKAIYGEWDMFEYVSNLVLYTPELQTATAFPTSWNLLPINRYQCEIIYYYDPIANEFAITINGIDMLPVMEREVKGHTLVSGFPLTAISPSGAIPFSKFDNEPMHNFFYSKSTPAKMRIIADLEDMTVKLMVLGMKQMRKPPKGNKSYRVFNSDMFLPGTITNDVREGELFDLLPNQNGIQPAEFSFYEALKRGRDEITTTRGFSGAGTGAGTATEAIQDKEQQMDKIALMLDGIMGGMRQYYWLRCWNIFANWTKPIDQEIDKTKNAFADIYRTVNLEKDIEGKQKGLKQIRFSTNPVEGATPKERAQNIHMEEIAMEKEKNTEVRISYLNPQMLRSMKLKWYWMVTPSPKNNDSLGQMMFAKAIQDAIDFFGPESLNVSKLKRKYAQKYGVDFDCFFLDEETLAQQQEAAKQAMMAQQGGQQEGGQPTIGTAATGKKPMFGQLMK